MLTNGGNKTAAYRFAYDTENMQEASINVNACMLAKNAKVALRIQAAQKERAERTNITLDRIQQELASIGLARLTRVAAWSRHGLSLHSSDLLTEEDAAAIQEVGESLTKFGRSMRIKMHDKVAALRTLAQMMGGLDTDKEQSTSVAVSGGLPTQDRV